MQVLILTTETKHHTYFINKLFEKFGIAGVVYERRRLAKDYPTGPFFANEEDQFEEKFFDAATGGVSRELPKNLMERMIQVHSVNQPGMAAYIQALEPDVAVTFGVGPVKPFIFPIPRWGTINVHRGISQHYRGLDSDLWAIYHKRFDQIGVTIHHVDEQLDAGDILAQECVAIDPQDEIYHLRYKTTLVATRLVISVLSKFDQAKGRLPGLPQQPIGPYYSAMPLSLKYQALQHFRRYRDSLIYAKS